MIHEEAGKNRGKGPRGDVFAPVALRTKEFNKENEKRFDAMTKEINALTEEVKDK